MSLLPALLFAALWGAHPLDPPAPQPAPAAPVPAPAPVIEPKAEALLAAHEKAMLALKSYSARCDTVSTYPPTPQRPEIAKRYMMSTLTAVKPNRMRYEGWNMKQTGTAARVKANITPTYVFTSDGKRSIKQFGDTYHTDTNVQPQSLTTLSEPWVGFYSPTLTNRVSFEAHKKSSNLKELRLAKPETVNGVRCEVIAYKYHTDDGEGQDYEGKLFIGPDKLVRRQMQSIKFGANPPILSDATLSNIRTNFAAPPASLYAYTPPPGVKSEAEAEAARPKLLASGTPAPDFTVEDLDGKPVKLSDFRGKTVLLDFWATWCGPCIDAMPHTNDAGQKFKDKNVVVVAVNVWDTKDAYKAWVPKNQAKYDAIVFLLDPKGSKGDVAKTLYNVSGIPTQYVIDPQGVIRAAFLGSGGDPEVLNTALAKAGEGK